MSTNLDVRQVVSIPLSQIHQLENSRADYRESELAELMTSMKQTGLLQPIGVKAIKNNFYSIVFGNRRFMAAGKLGWSTIDCLITEADTEEDFLCKNLTENLVRSGVSLQEQGRVYQRLTKLGLTTSEIAARVGTTTNSVQIGLNLFRRIPEKFHERIQVGGPGAGRGRQDKKGMIPMNAAKVIDTASKSYDLDKKDIESLFHLASQDKISTPTLAAVSKLVAQGFEIEDALKKHLETEVIKVNFVLTKKEIARVEREFKTPIKSFLYGIVLSDDRVKVSRRKK